MLSAQVQIGAVPLINHASGNGGFLMKAIVYSQYGSPDVLEITDISKPIPNERQVLVRVVASAVNTADVRTRY